MDERFTCITLRALAAGTRRVVATGLVDAGSGYNGQSDQPVHLGVGDAAAVDIEVTVPAGGQRVVTRVPAQPVSGARILTVRARRR